MDPALALRSDWLEAFIVFAEHANFTRAAKALHLSQPALHVQIAKLSEALGVPLYVRRGRLLELTREGTRLLAFARETRERSSEFVSHLSGDGSDEPVVLCAGEGAYLYLLGDAVREFSKRHTAPLRLLTRERVGTLDAIRSGEAHLGVAVVDGVPDDIEVQDLCEVEQVVVVPQRHPLAIKRAVHVKNLAGARLILPPEGRPHRAMLSRAFQAANVPWHVAAEASGWELMVHFAALGIGLTVVNDFCRIPKGMVGRPVRDLPRVRYSLLSRRNVRPRERVSQLRALIVERVRSVVGRSPRPPAQSLG
jgi:DNA-binding transcriptional LysR family regulator